MELRQLRYFDAVARHGNFTRAAEELRIAQPAVSAAVQQLEAELGVTLLQRTTRRVALTHAGELFLARVHRVFQELTQARTDVEELTEVLRGHVRIGVTPVLGALDLPAALAKFQKRYPGVRLTMRTGLIADLLDAVSIGEIDIVLGPVHAELPDRFVATELCAETLVLITPPGHLRNATLATVADEAFVCLTPGSGLRTILTEAAAAEGFTPRIAFETFSPASVRELVAAGVGVAVLARSSAEAPGPPIDIHPLTPAPAHPPIGLIALRKPVGAPAVRAFENILKRQVRP